MIKRSAGILMYRRRPGGIEIFLIHPGGPLWAKKDDGAWSIPKGLYSDDEDPLAAGRREFKEETGFDVDGDFTALGEIRQASGKRVVIWAVEGDCDPAEQTSNLFTMEWPPRSGRTQEFPEADRGGWFSIDEGRRKLLSGQVAFLDRLQTQLI